MASYIPPDATIQGGETPEQKAERERREEQAAAAAAGGQQGAGRQGLNVQKSQTPSGANFEITGANNEKYNAHGAALGDIAKAQEDRKAKGQSPLLSVDELMAKNDATFGQADAITNEQATRGGVEVGDAVANAGGIGGFFGGKEVVKHYTAGNSADTTTDGNKAQLADRVAGIENRPDIVATAATLNQGRADHFRQGQKDLVGSLTAAANGQGPSAAQDQFRLATNRNLADALALARSGKGNQAAAMKNAQLQRAGISQDAAAQSGMLAAQEQNAARAQLGSVLSDSRAQDLGAATTNAGMQQQTNIANLGAGVDQQKQRDTMIAQYVAQGMTLDAAQRQAEIQQAQFNAELLARQAAADKGVAMQSSQAAGQTAATTVGAVAGAVGAAVASDRKLKKNVGDGDDDVKAFLDDLVAHTFEYKNKSQYGGGQRVGIMAQDAEKSGMGRGFVMNTPDGKMLDSARAVGAALAGLANVNKRLSAIERG